MPPMIKFLFFDYRQFERVDGFTRSLEPPRKHGEAVLLAEKTWEMNSLGLYGSVIRLPEGQFRMWYTCGTWGCNNRQIAYAESEDGVVWRRPNLGLVEWEGEPTNIVMQGHTIGVGVIYDDRDPRPGWRYKLLTATEPSDRVCGYRSADGIHWLPIAENPVMGVKPDGPIGLFRHVDGRYVAYHRPFWGDRRVGRSESWDFIHWPETRVVAEPDQNDPTNIQFYGMGAVPYGDYEIGTLWVYHTTPDDMCWSKMLGVLDVEFIHSRGGYAWHRTAQGTPWIALSEKDGAFDSAQINAASQPVLMEDEIRYYYAGCRRRHGEDKGDSETPAWGISFASCKPDRFVSVRCAQSGHILTRPFWVKSAKLFVNADVSPGGYVRAEVLSQETPWSREAYPVQGFTMADSVPVTGDSWRHVLRWKSDPDLSVLNNREIRVRLEAKDAKLYSITIGSDEQVKRYWEFRVPYFLPMKFSKDRF